MDHLIGQKFSLISKSEIRYVGILHEINPEQSTIALEEVYSFGTEDRKSGPEFIPASNQKFEYIVFRGSDVKDIKIADDQKENQQTQQPNVPNDPAILNSSRPPAPSSSQGPPPSQNRPQPPPGYPPQHPGYYNPYGYGPPPPPGNFRPGPGFPPYGPPPGAPPGGPPGGPPGWFNAPPNPFPQPPGGFGPGPAQFPPGQRGPPGPPGQQLPPGPPHKFTSELPVDAPSQSKATTPKPSSAAPTPPVDSKPSVAEALGSSSTAPVPQVLPHQPIAGKPSVPGAAKKAVTPALPAVQAIQKTPVQTSTNGIVAKSAPQGEPKPAVASNSAAMAEATRQATAAVAAAMAKLPQAGNAPSKAPVPSNAVDELAQKVGQMRTPSDSNAPRGRGRGRGSRGAYNAQTKTVEVPKDDYDFATANAKFNKEDLIKEAIASGSPIGEGVPDSAEDGILETATNGMERKDSIPSSVSGTSGQVYNRSTSFFDNISSELKEKDEDKGRRPGWRGEEMKRNIETFGQGSVDSGYRGGFRGRGRGRGYGRGGQRGFGRGGNFRGRGRGDAAVAATAPQTS